MSVHEVLFRGVTSPFTQAFKGINAAGMIDE